MKHVLGIIVSVTFILTTFSIVVPVDVSAQVNEEWVIRYNDFSNGPDDAKAMALGLSGNIYITGRSGSDWASTDFLTIAYDPSGVMLWTARYDGPGNGEDYGLAIAVDSSENVYVTGSSVNTMMNRDYTTIAYNSSGVMLWVATYNGPANSIDIATAIVVDSHKNVYITGGSHNFTIGPRAEFDITTIAYDSLGNELWVATYDGPGMDQDIGRDIDLDSKGNIYVTGECTNGAYHDYVTLAYDLSGNNLWITRYEGPVKFTDAANALALGLSGNVYVTGLSWTLGSNFDCTTIAYDSDGNELWVARYNGLGNGYDEGFDIVVDSYENVYVTGRSTREGLNFDYLTIGYDSKGNERWVKTYNGPGNSYDGALSMTIDSANNIYITGKSRGNGTFFDYTTISYDMLGNQRWIVRYNGVENRDDVAEAIVVDSSYNVYITGGSSGGITHYDYTTVKYIQEVSPRIIIDIDPNTLNLKSKGKWITCYIDPPLGYEINDIEINTILLEDTVSPMWTDIQGDKLMVKFNRNDVQNLLPVGNYNLKVTGELTDGTSFEGYSDEIRVIDSGK